MSLPTRRTLISPALLAAIVLAGCGQADQASSPARSAATAMTTREAAAVTASYTPAPASCAAMPGPTAAASSLMSGTVSHTSGYRVCGPFAASASASSFGCPVSAPTAGPYRLLVYNGLPDGTFRASSARVRVNGVEVLGPSRFDQQVGAATARILLTASNTIDVSIAGGDTMRLEVVDESQACSILAPADVSAAGHQASISTGNAFPVHELQVFNGGLDGSAPASQGQVFWNGSPVVSSTVIREKTTAALMPLALTGSDVLSASAGKKGLFSVQIVDRDVTAPRFSVSAPVDGSFTNQPQVAVSGSIDDSSAKVTVNDARATLGGGGFAVQATLVECWNIITVAATDACGNASQAQVRVGLDTVPPVLAVTSPPAGFVTNLPIKSVVLRYSDNFSGVDPSSIRLTLDGADVTGALVIGADLATGTLSLAAGAHTLRAQVSDQAGNTTTQQAGLLVDLTPPVLAIVAPVDGTTIKQKSVPATITYSDALSGVDLSTLAVLLDGQDVTTTFAAGPVSASAALALAAGPHQLDVRISDLAGNASSARSSFTVVTGGGFPPDPRSVAPPNDLTVATDIAKTVSFLYSGDSPIQTGVAPGTIDARRVAVVRGFVKERDGAPLAGVRVTVSGHAELGATLTRSDGTFDLAVNGGGILSLAFQKDGYLVAQRQLDLPWRDYVRAPEVALVPFDTVVTAVQAGAPALQVARGSPATDRDGTRQATVMFPAGLQASLVMPDGSTSSLGAFHARATEYTVGSDGRSAMPAQLPPTTGYTYAVELSVDEAVMAGAKTVTFSQPVPVYLENFLRAPAGTIVPSGYYDRVRGVWVPSQDGRVLAVLSVTGGTASIDADGDGLPDSSASVAALGVTADELAQIATLYTPGQTLWRVPVNHFSAWDFNFAFGCAKDSDGNACSTPHSDDPTPSSDEENPDCATGSIIECQNQVLGEELRIVGTPFSLSYRSSRQVGRLAERTLRIPLPSKASSLSEGLAVEVDVAGQHFRRDYPPAPGGDWTFAWDGRDAYGRPVQGGVPVTVKIGTKYHPVLAAGSVTSGGAGGGSGGGGGGVVMSFGNSCYHGDTCGSLTREGDLLISWRMWRGTLFAWEAQSVGLGGWTLDAHHAYEPTTGTLLLGDGTHRKAASIANGVASTFSRTTGGPYGIAVAPDGSVYVAEYYVVEKIAPDGSRTTVAGGGSCNGPQYGVPATQVCLWGALDVAVASDGSLFIAHLYAAEVARVRPDGIIERFAGNRQAIGAAAGDEGSALDAVLGYPSSVAVAPDGSVYILAQDRIRRVSPDGLIHTVAGGIRCCGNASCGTCCYSGDGGLASQAGTCGGGNYGKIAAGLDGSVYLADPVHSVVRRVRPDGYVETVAGTGAAGFSGDGGPATSATLNGIMGISVGQDGSLFIADRMNLRVRSVTPDGIIHTVAGTGQAGQGGDGGPAVSATFQSIWHAVPTRNGEVLVADDYVARVRKVGLPLPGFTYGDALIASEDGREVYVFASGVRHARTIDAATGQTLLAFGYDASGLLVSVADRDGNVTTIERDGSGRPLAIVAPGGQRTTLSLDANGYLASVANPAQEAAGYGYDANGLMLSYTDPRGYVHGFRHDDLGRLLFDGNPAGGSKSLTRSPRDSGYKVAVTTALGRTTLHEVLAYADDSEILWTTRSDGTVTTRNERPATASTQVSTPDGAKSWVTRGPDPRFGMAASTVSQILGSPGGLQRTLTENRTATLADPANPLSATATTTTLTVNGRAWSSSYSSATRRTTFRSPAGRTSTTTLDAKARTSRIEPPGVPAIDLSYDAKGRLEWLTQGARTYHVEYDGAGNPWRFTDPVSRQVTLEYDAAGRVWRQSMADGRQATFGYDRSGNLSWVAPPGRPGHSLGSSSVDQLASYTPPPVVPGGATWSTGYSYDLDGALTQVLLPDATTIVPGYDAAGRLSSLTTAHDSTVLGYDLQGRVSTVTAGSGSLTYGYDGFLLTSETWAGTVPGSVGWSYDNDFRVKTQTVNGSSVGFGYDADGILTQAGALTLTPEPATGRLSSTSLGTVTTGWTYTTYGEPWVFTASAGGTGLYSFTLSRDLSGKITGKTETIGGVTTNYVYGFDPAGRLQTVTQNGTLLASYGYDDNGNRMTRTTETGTESGSYDDQDRMRSYGGATYSYRRPGALESRTDASGTTWFDYDGLGSLRAVLLPTGARIDYVIDGQGRRVGKKVNGLLAEGFLYEGKLRPVAWLDGAGQVKARFVYGLHVNVPEYMVTASGTFRFVTDHLGSLRLVVDAASGAVAQRIDYDESGVVLADSNPGFQPFGFAGGLSDRDTGLVRFGARDYDPQTGRWTNKDPVGFNGGDTNLYVYVGADPLNWIDPTGLDWVDWDFQPYADFVMGLGDALTFGASGWVRDQAGLGQFANKCSGAYKAGELASFAVGTGRLAYAGAAKALPFLIRGGNTMERALQISAARNELKLLFRAGLFAESRMPTALEVASKYGGNAEAIINAATRTNLGFNAAGAWAAGGAAYNEYGP